MALDRFIYWQVLLPKVVEVDQIITDYFGGGTIATSIQKESPPPGHDLFTWYITISGTKSQALRRQHAADPAALEERSEGERWIEVIFSPTKYLDVLTRQMDEVTNAIADGLRDVFLRYFNARRNVE